MAKFQPTLRYILRRIPAITVAVLPSACSANNTVKNIYPETRVVGSEVSSLQIPQDEFENLVRNVDIKSQIMDQYADWKGVCYYLGSGTKRGIDCSGFAQHTFREQSDLKLSRSTYEQQEMGKSVPRSNLRMGDLVLLRAGSTGRHVDTYIGNNQFVHASTSSGIIISSMNEPHWKKRYNEARRVLSRS